jgi:hypothetical protein
MTVAGPSAVETPDADVAVAGAGIAARHHTILTIARVFRMWRKSWIAAAGWKAARPH